MLEVSYDSWAKGIKKLNEGQPDLMGLIQKQIDSYEAEKTVKTIEITGFYDEIAWYSKMIGKTFELSEIKEDGHVKVQMGIKYSYWVGPNDYKFV